MPHVDSEHGLRVQLATALRERDEAIKERDELLRKLRVMCDAHSDLSARGFVAEKLLGECETAFRTLPLNYQPTDLLGRLAALAARAAAAGEDSK